VANQIIHKAARDTGVHYSNAIFTWRWAPSYESVRGAHFLQGAGEHCYLTDDRVITVIQTNE